VEKVSSQPYIYIPVEWRGLVYTSVYKLTCYMCLHTRIYQ